MQESEAKCRREFLRLLATSPLLALAGLPAGPWDQFLTPGTTGSCANGGTADPSGTVVSNAADATSIFDFEARAKKSSPSRIFGTSNRVPRTGRGFGETAAASISLRFAIAGWSTRTSWTCRSNCSARAGIPRLRSLRARRSKPSIPKASWRSQELRARTGTCRSCRHSPARRSKMSSPRAVRRSGSNCMPPTTSTWRVPC